MIKTTPVRSAATAAILVAAALSTAGVTLAADPAKDGPEFQISAYTTGHQDYPRVAMNGSGDFIVVWESDSQDGSSSGIFAQRYDSVGASLGSEFQVNTYFTFNQLYPVPMLDPSGDFVIAWDSAIQDGEGAGVFMRRFDSSGMALSGDLQVNTYTSNYQTLPAVAGDDAGRFVAVWNSFNQVDPNAFYDVFGQAFRSDGVRLRGEFRVNSETYDYQRVPAVAMNGIGKFVVVWDSFYQDGDASGIFGQIFDRTGARVGPEFQVNDWTTGFQGFARVAMHDSGRFVVVWDDYGRDGSFYGVFGRLFSSSGQPVGASFQVNTSTTDYQRLPAVAMDEAGNFVVVWDDYGRDGDGYGVTGQFFDSTGNKFGSEFVVNTYSTEWQRIPDVAMDDAGNFVVTWQSRDQDGDYYGVFGQRFLTPKPYAVASPMDGGSVDCSNPALSRPTITWDSGRFNRFVVFVGSDPVYPKGTFVKSWDGWKPVFSWTPGKKKWAAACKKALAGDPNNPVLHIRVRGRDDDLPKGDPMKLGFTSSVQVDALF